MSIIKPIAFNNLAGISKLYYALKTDIAFLPASVEGIVADDVVFFPGKRWLKIDVTIGAAHDETVDLNEKGLFYKQRVSFSFPVISEDISLFEVFEKKTIVALIKTLNGFFRLVGDLQQPMLLKTASSSGGQPTQYQGWNAEIFGQTNKKSPLYTGFVQLDPSPSECINLMFNGIDLVFEINSTAVQNILVIWGDGQSEQQSITGFENVSHSYAFAQVYQVSLCFEKPENVSILNIDNQNELAPGLQGEIDLSLFTILESASFTGNQLQGIVLGAFWNAGEVINIDLTGNAFTTFLIEQLTIYLNLFTTDVNEEKTINLYGNEIIKEPAISNANQLFVDFKVRVLALAVQANLEVITTASIYPDLIIFNLPDVFPSISTNSGVNIYPIIEVLLPKLFSMAKVTIQKVVFSNEQNFYEADLLFTNAKLIDGENVDPDQPLNVAPPGVEATPQNFLFGTNPDNILAEYDVDGTIQATTIEDEKHVLQKARALYPLDTAEDATVVAAFGAAKTSFRQGNWAMTIRLDHAGFPDDNDELIVGFVNGFVDIAAVQAFISGGGTPRVMELNNGFGPNFQQSAAIAQPAFNIVTAAVDADGINDIIEAIGVTINYVGSWYCVSKQNGIFETFIEFSASAAQFIYSFGRGQKGIRIKDGIDDESVTPAAFETANFALYRYSNDGTVITIERNGVSVISGPSTIGSSEILADVTIFGGPELGANFSDSSVLYFCRFNGIEDPGKVTERTNQLKALYNL